MNNDCDHDWVSNSGRGGKPEYQINRSMHPTKPLMHCQCRKCKDRIWVTKDSVEKISTQAIQRDTAH